MMIWVLGAPNAALLRTALAVLRYDIETRQSARLAGVAELTIAHQNCALTIEKAHDAQTRWWRKFKKRDSSSKRSEGLSASLTS
jgi:hypothetical protein